MGAESYRTDVALLSVTDTEYGGVKLMHDWEPFSIPGDDQHYEKSVFIRDGKEHSIIHTRQSDMGMTSAALTATKVIYEFRPRYLIMVGIAAGVAKTEVADQIYGDVLVPDIVWDFSSGKIVSPELEDDSIIEPGFLPRPRFESIPERVLEIVRKAAVSPENQCQIQIGPMACGTGVVANRKFVERRIHHQKRDTIGLDMESYGIVYAVSHASEPRPLPIVIKSVCDYASSEKGDDFQKFAAFTSCEFAKLLYERFLPME